MPPDIEAPPAPTAERIPVEGTPSEAMPLLPAELQADAPPAQGSLVLGVSGQKYQAGHSAEEYHADLSDRQQAIERYDQLRIGNALVAGPLARIESQLRQADWGFSPGPRLAPPPSIASLREKHQMEASDSALDDLEHEAVQFHRSWLLGAPAQEYAMETSWTQQALHECALSLAFPASIFEIVWRRVDGRLGTRIVPQVLRWMHPRSIRAFKVDENGRLLGITQAVQHSWDPSQDESFGGQRSNWHRVFIPADRLLIVSRNREGTMPEGTPLVRHMFADAERAAAAIQWQLIDAQNRAVGIPFVKIPAGVTGKAVENATKQARRMTYGNQHLAYVVAPEGIEVGFVDMSANTVDLGPLVTAQERRMRHVSGTEFTALGAEGGSGSWALAKVLREEFNTLVTGIAAAIIEDLQRGIVEKCHAINYADSLAAPRLHATGLITIDPADVALLVEKKVITADADVTNAARRSLGLPPLEKESSAKLDTSQLTTMATAKAIAITGDALVKIHEALGLPPPSPEKVKEYNEKPLNTSTGGGLPGLPAGPMAPVAPQAPGTPSPTDEAMAKLATMAAPPPHRSGTAYWRELTPHERDHVDLAAIRAGFERFADRTREKLTPLRAAAVKEIVSNATTSDKSSKLGGRLEPSKETRERMRAAIRGLAETMLDRGREEAGKEIRSQAAHLGQRVDLASRAGLPASKVRVRVENEIDLISELNADAILDAIEPALRRIYMRSRETGADPVAALERASVDVTASGSQVIDQAGREVASTAFNSGRALTVAETESLLADGGLEVATVTRTEILDDRTCEDCESLDGNEYDVDSEDYWTYEPPNFCQGGERCRGFYAIEVSKLAG